MGQQQDGSVLERRISIDYQNQTLDYILEQISWQAGVYFSYNATEIDPQQTYSVSAENKSLYTVLHSIFKPQKITLSERENQVIISKSSKPLVVLNETDTVPVKYFFLSGKIIEEKRGKPVPYASVSVFKKPIGTISNNDGEFILKLHPDNISDTVIISCMGYGQKIVPASLLLDEDLFILQPISIRIREVRVTAISANQVLVNFRRNLDQNYSSEMKYFSAFYRETVRQDGDYINVSEAVLDVLKSSYVNTFREDLVRVVKGRRSPEVKPFYWLNFKLQGGPFTITKLDAVKTVESFLDEEYENMYKYRVDDVIRYNGYPVYVVRFEPLFTTFFPAFEGEMYIHRDSYALVHAKYWLNRSGLRDATSVMIRKKPRKVRARPSFVEYTVNYQKYDGKWHLLTAQASVKFKVRSKRDKLNSEFHSVSDLLVTNIKDTDLKRFARDEIFTQSDIFVEMLGKYDEQFWENYNIIKPDEDLRNAFKAASID
jgi:hypothetical protein